MRGWSGIITHGPKIISTLGRFAGGFRNASVATSAFSGTAGTLGGRMRGIITWFGSMITGAGKWLAKLPALIAGNLALAGTYTAIALAAAASAYAVYEAVKAAQAMWQAENDLLALKDQNAAAEQDLERKMAEKYGRGSQKYQQGMENAGMGQGVGTFDSGYSHPWYWGPAWKAYDEVRGFANEGIVKASPGGSVVRVAEGGEDEAIIKTSRLGGTTVKVALNFHGPVVGGRAGLRELSSMIQRDVMSGVQRGLGGVASV